MSGRAACALALLLACKPDVDFTQGRPYLCDSDSQCGTGWRCGLEGQCHQVGQSGTYRCAGDAGACEASWACGVDGFCLNPDDAGSNACFSDHDCFHGRRCDADGRCVDPSGELLGGVDSPPGPPTLLGPLFVPQGVTGSALTWAIEPRTNNPMRDSQRFSRAVVTNNGQVTVLASDPKLEFIYALDAGTYPAGVQQVAANDLYVWIQTTADLLAMGTQDASMVLVPSPTPVHDNMMTPLGPLWDLRSIFLNSAGAIAFATDGGSDFHLVSGGVGGGVLRHGPGSDRCDIVGLASCLFAADQGALYTLETGPGGMGATWNPLALPEFTNDGTYVDGGPKPTRLRATTPNIVAVAFDFRPVSPDMTDASYPGALATLSDIALFDVSQLLFPGGGADAGPPPCAPSTGQLGREARVTKLLGNCNACTFSNESLLDFHPVALDTTWGVQTDCVVNGIVHTYLLTETVNGVCQREKLTGSQPQLKGQLNPALGGTNPYGIAKSGQHGELWIGDDLIDAQPVFLDRAPSGIFQPRLRDGGGFGALHAFADQWTTEQMGLGLQVINTSNQPPLAASVGGTVSAVVYTDRRVSQMFDTGQTNFATVNATDETFLPPYAARAVKRSDEACEYIVRSFDTMYSGHQDPQSTTSNFNLKLQLVPAAGSPILAAVFQAMRDPDAGELEGWVLTATGVQAVTQDKLDTWSATPVTTPAGIRVALFLEGHSGRVAYDDGTVYSLPSRVLLAPPVADTHFTSFARACDETWGMTTNGLYRLHPVDGGTGVWLNEPLDSADPYNFSAAALSGGRIIQLNNRIYVFNAFGGAVSFVPQTGCDPAPGALAAQCGDGGL